MAEKDKFADRLATVAAPGDAERQRALEDVKWAQRQGHFGPVTVDTIEAALRAAPTYRHDCEAWRMEGIGCSECNPIAREIAREMAAPIEARQPAWQPIDTAPKMRKVIVFYLNALEKRRTVMACYYKKHSLNMDDDYAEVGEYDEASGESYAPEGWYEEHDSDNPLMPLEGEPTHWMPLPAPPEARATPDHKDGQ